MSINKNFEPEDSRNSSNDTPLNVRNARQRRSYHRTTTSAKNAGHRDHSHERYQNWYTPGSLGWLAQQARLRAVKERQVEKLVIMLDDYIRSLRSCPGCDTICQIPPDDYICEGCRAEGTGD